MSINVLIVDDSAVVRMMIQKMLKIAGLPIGEVFQGANGKEGLAVLDNNWVDIVFADINMPVMNGEEMIEEIRKNPAWTDLPIVVVSTEGSLTRIQRLQQHGAKFIHKPFTPETVREVVTSITGLTLEDSNGQQEQSF